MAFAPVFAFVYKAALHDFENAVKGLAGGAATTGLSSNTMLQSNEINIRCIQVGFCAQTHNLIMLLQMVKQKKGQAKNRPAIQL